MPNKFTLRDDALFQRAVGEEATVFAEKVAVRVAAAAAYRALIGFLQSYARYQRISFILTSDLTTLLAVNRPPADVVLAARELEAVLRFFQSGGQLRGGAAVRALLSLRSWLRTIGDWVEDDPWTHAPTTLLGSVAYNKGAMTPILGMAATA